MSAMPKRSSTAIVMDAVDELHALEQLVTRETLVEHTGLKLSVIDDRIGVLIEDGQVHRVRSGVFVPAKKFPPARAISHTHLPDGWGKLEIGDEMLTLTPRETRILGAMLQGAALQGAAIESGHHAAVLAASLAERVRKLERDNKALRTKHPEAQLTLAGLEPVALLGGIST